MRCKALLWAPLLLLSALAAPVAAERQPYSVFPDSAALFAPPIADPRHIALSASYYRLSGQDTADVALGHCWAMARWYSHGGYWTYQWDIAGMAYSRFTLDEEVNSFETVDFSVELPVAARHRGFSTRLALFHQSSHLGDDYIRRTNDQGFRYAVEGLKAQFSIEPSYYARVYAGGAYILHSVPAPARAAQIGFEITGHDFGLFRSYPMRLFLAQDFQSHENARWDVNSRTTAGLEVGFKNARRHMRVYGGYFDGHSPFGQFFRRRERYLDFGISFHL